MTEIYLKKTPYGLLPDDSDAADFLHNIRDGAVLRAKISQPRNVKFHRKAFALLKFLFDNWQPGDASTYKGMTVHKDIERFREEITILAGYYTATYSVSGSVRLKPMSWSFSSMDDATFEKLYSKLIDVGLQKILPETYSEESLRHTVDELLTFS